MRARHRGFTYLTVLFIVAILMGGLALVGEAWETNAKREKEAELLYAGEQYRKAIRRYYESSPVGARRYPAGLEELLDDPRQPATLRHLRQLYPDPFGSGEWGVVRAPDGGIAGVYSRSEEKPLRIANFALRDAGFESAKRYSDWKFVYAPVTAAAVSPGVR